MKNHFALRNGNVLSTEITAEINKSKEILKRNNFLDSEYSKDNSNNNNDSKSNCEKGDDRSEGLDDDDDNDNRNSINKNTYDDSK